MSKVACSIAVCVLLVMSGCAKGNVEVGEYFEAYFDYLVQYVNIPVDSTEDIQELERSILPVMLSCILYYGEQYEQPDGIEDSYFIPVGDAEQMAVRMYGSKYSLNGYTTEGYQFATLSYEADAERFRFSLLLLNYDSEIEQTALSMYQQGDRLIADVKLKEGTKGESDSLMTGLTYTFKVQIIDGEQYYQLLSVAEQGKGDSE